MKKKKSEYLNISIVSYKLVLELTYLSFRINFSFIRDIITTFFFPINIPSQNL